MCPWQHCGSMTSACLAGGSVHCDHLTKGVSVTFLQGKVISLPFSLEGSHLVQTMFKERRIKLQSLEKRISKNLQMHFRTTSERNVLRKRLWGYACTLLLLKPRPLLLAFQGSRLLVITAVLTEILPVLHFSYMHSLDSALRTCPLTLMRLSIKSWIYINAHLWMFVLFFGL